MNPDERRGLNANLIALFSTVGTFFTEIANFLRANGEKDPADGLAYALAKLNIKGQLCSALTQIFVVVATTINFDTKSDHK